MSLPEPHAARGERFRAALAARGLDGAVVTWGPHVRYLTGIVAEWAPVFLVIGPARIAAVVPASAGIAATPGVEIVAYGNGMERDSETPRQATLAALSAAMAASGVESARLGVEAEHARLSDLSGLPGLSLPLEEMVDVGPILARQRQRKDAAEIARLRDNARVLTAGFEAAREAIRPGVTELAVWAAMHAAMMAVTGAPFALDGNFASGPRTLEDEPQATNRRLEAGDVVFVDLYPAIEGYSADLTRTFVVGQPSAAQRARHAVLERALAAGVAALRPGATAGDVDRAARSAVATALDGYAYPHHTGHAIGLEGQERPYIIPGEPMVLEPGMVIAIEPGAYLPDTGGMRLEGNFLITESGCETLSDYPFELIACG
jgi:Xaa-Pro aminopeptidase